MRCARGRIGNLLIGLRLGCERLAFTDPTARGENRDAWERSLRDLLRYNPKTLPAAPPASGADS